MGRVHISYPIAPQADIGFSFFKVYAPEILPLAHRAKGEGLATACLWLSTFVVVEIVPVAIANIGWRVYLIFACFNLAFIPFIYFFVPEVSLNFENAQENFKMLTCFQPDCWAQP